MRKDLYFISDNFIDEAYGSIRLDISFVKDFEIVLNYIDKLQREKENAKWYIHQMIARINEDIADFIDDDKEGNKNIIGELKEDLEKWKDVEKLLNGESKDNLYIDWRKYGEYE